MAKPLTPYLRNFMILPVFALAACGGSADKPRRIGPAVAKPAQQSQPKKESKPGITFDVQFTPDDGKSCDRLAEQFNLTTRKAQAKPRTIDVERQFKRKIVRDCDGNVLSDYMTTVKTGTYELDLKAPAARQYQGVFVYNDATCDHRLTSMPIQDSFIIGNLYNVTGDGETGVQIKADMAQATFTFHTRGGLNDIYVQYFYDCMPDGVSGNKHVSVGRSSCSQSQNSLIVHYPITINYTETTLPGVIEEVESAEKCTQQVEDPILLHSENHI
jgi:hypothetical protein